MKAVEEILKDVEGDFSEMREKILSMPPEMLNELPKILASVDARSDEEIVKLVRGLANMLRQLSPSPAITDENA